MRSKWHKYLFKMPRYLYRYITLKISTQQLYLNNQNLDILIKFHSKLI